MATTMGEGEALAATGTATEIGTATETGTETGTGTVTGIVNPVPGEVGLARSRGAVVGVSVARTVPAGGTTPTQRQVAEP